MDFSHCPAGFSIFMPPAALLPYPDIFSDPGRKGEAKMKKNGRNEAKSAYFELSELAGILDGTYTYKWPLCAAGREDKHFERWTS